MKKVYNISKKDFDFIEKSIYENGLSYYKLDKKDFICYKDGNKIISYVRIYNIGENDYELSCLYVFPEYRGKYLGIEIIKDIINLKITKKKNLFLACSKDKKDYYKKVSFTKITENIPEKLKHTLIWAEENNIDAIIMKYNF